MAPASSTPDQGDAILKDASRLTISRVTPSDAPLLADGFARLSAESRRLRFLTAKPHLTPSEIRYLTDVDGRNHEALGAVDPATGHGIGIARFIRDDRDPTRAEVAVTVVDEWQGRGVGRLLLTKLAERARAEGIRRFTALVSTDNTGMQALLERLGGPLRVTGLPGQASAEYEIELGQQGLGAALEEALRAAARGQWLMPPRLREAIKALVPVNLSRR